MERVISAGLASYGMSGRVFHAPLLAHNPGFLLAAVVERSGKTVLQRYPGVCHLESFDALLADDSIELVVVNTPDHTHHALARRALESGRHVVVEKPFTKTSEEARDLIELARQNERVLSVFQNRRWDGDFMTVRQVIAEGTLGRIVELEARWDRFRPMVDLQSWKERTSNGSGALPNLGSHLVDQALILFGWPARLTARLSVMRDGAEAEDWIDLRLHYDRLEVTLRTSYLARNAGPRFRVHGTRGSFVKYGLDPQEAALVAGVRPDSDAWGEDDPALWGTLSVQDVPERIRTLPGCYANFYDGIHAAISAGKAVPVTAEDGLNVVRLLEAARRSNQLGSTISLEATT